MLERGGKRKPRPGRQEEAEAGAAEFIRLYPKFSLDYFESGPNRPTNETWRVGDYSDLHEKFRIVESLRKAGLE